jgi:hypothetical protein
MAMIFIASQTVPSGGSPAIIFSSIPQTFTHLQVRCFSRSTFAGATASFFIRLNADGGSNYAFHSLSGNGSSAVSSGLTSQTVGQVGLMSAATSTAGIFDSTIIDILDYRNTNKNKTIRSIGGNDRSSAGTVYLGSSLWMNTQAVNSITLISGGAANLAEFSTFQLYGISTSGITGA